MGIGSELSLRGGSIIKLASGREVHANGHILGIGPDGIYGGYDDQVDDCQFTPEERRELAEIAMDRWKLWAVTGEVSEQAD